MKALQCDRCKILSEYVTRDKGWITVEIRTEHTMGRLLDLCTMCTKVVFNDINDPFNQKPAQ